MRKAYNENWIRNLEIQRTASSWLAKNLITAEQHALIAKQYPSEFYRPGLFVKLGLFFFGCIGCSFFAGFVSLFLINEGSDSSLAFMSAICCICYIIFLERLIPQNKLYHSGIDNALLYSACFAAVMPVFLTLQHAPTSVYCMIALFIAAAAVIRYADLLAAASCFALIITLVFLLLTDFQLGKLILPFVIMAASAAMYFGVRKVTDIYYQDCRKVIEMLSLGTFYLGGNYLVVREGNAALTNVSAAISPQIALAELFYALTLLTPFIYIFFGLKKRDRLLLVTGLLALAFSVYTYKHYFSWLTVSQELTLAGALLILLAGALIQYLKRPRHGISDEPAKRRRFSDLEALVAAQVIQQPAPQDGVNFGGGNFGGGGAGERY